MNNPQPNPQSEATIAIGERIRIARERLQWSQLKLAQILGLGSSQIVSNIESGVRELKARELSRIAKVLHISIDALLVGEQDLQPVCLWRDRPTTGAEEIEAIFLRRCEKYALLEQWCGVSALNELKPITLSRKSPSFAQIEREAENVRDQMRLGGRPACSLEKTLQEDYGVKIFYADLGENGSGISAKGNFGYGILLNSREAPWRRKYSLAHELFHLLTAGDWDSPEQEKLANVFASALLLPAEPLLGIVRSRAENKMIPYSSLVETACEFDVSTDALLWRLANLGFTTKEAVQKALASPSLRTLDRAGRPQPQKLRRLPERFERLCLLAYRKEKIGRAKLAEFLEVSLVDLADQLHQLDTEMEIENGAEQAEIALAGC